MHVYFLHHVYEIDEESDDVKVIGIYESEEAANLAINQLTELPGFCNHKTGFSITEYLINKNHWTEGFVSDAA